MPESVRPLVGSAHAWHGQHIPRLGQDRVPVLAEMGNAGSNLAANTSKRAKSSATSTLFSRVSTGLSAQPNSAKTPVHDLGLPQGFSCRSINDMKQEVRVNGLFESCFEGGYESMW